MTPQEIFEKAYDILVHYAKAPRDDHYKDTFVSYFTERPLAYEWRFGGLLGFGGKFWRNDNRYYVSCYPEDRTSNRTVVMAEVNRLLAELPYWEPAAV